MSNRQERIGYSRANDNWYALIANPTIYASLIEQFWQIATVEIVNNEEQQLSVIVDGKIIAITEASVRRHLQLADANGISSLPNTKIFEQLTLMGYVSNDDKLTFQKDEAIIKEMHDGLVRATTIASSLEAEQGSGNIAKTQTKATSSGPSSPRTSSEGGPGCHFTIWDIPVQTRPEKVSNLPNEPPLREDKVTSLEDELASTKAVYNKALITLTKRGRMIDEIDNDETVNLVKSRELGKSYDTAKHRMESEHDDDDRTLAETLLNIKRSSAKGKAIMQESEPLKKIKKKKMIQISLDEEFAKSFYEEEQAHIMQDEYRQLRIVLSAKDKLNYLELPIPATLVLVVAGHQVPPETLAAHAAWVKGQKEIVEEGQSVRSYIFKMKGYIDNLERLGHPVSLSLAVSLILVSLRKEYDSFVQNYNMHGMGKMVNELHAMLKLHEQTLPKRDAHALHAIRAEKIPPPPKKEEYAKDSVCHHCGDTGHWKWNRPQYLSELLKYKKLPLGASTSGIFTIELFTFLGKSWVYDTGYGTHICNNTQGFRGSRKLKPGALSLYMGNG
ncbi:hypothetical protein Tco_1406668 [Tanacetum coccineum]